MVIAVLVVVLVVVGVIVAVCVCVCDGCVGEEGWAGGSGRFMSAWRIVSSII